MSRSWTHPADVAAKVRRRWDDGTLLRAHAAGEPFPVVEVPLRGPRAAEIGDDLDAVRSWIVELERGEGARYALVRAGVGGRHFGRNEVPARAVVTTWAQAWSLLGVGANVQHFDSLLVEAGERLAVRAWVLERPLRALPLSDDWPRIVAAYDWLDAHRASGAYLREVSAPGVDTKLAERHRTTLAGMLGVSASSTGFLADLGLRAKPQLVRLRVSPALGLPPALSELAVRPEELAALPLTPTSVLVCENEITYLSVPVPTDGAVLWGKGFDVDQVGRLPWLRDVGVTYWGDLDTHGFAILDRLRAFLPQVRSVLMDTATLLAHEDRWGREERPTRAALPRLTRDETATYDALVTDQLGDKVRLEQERVDWGWAMRALSSAW